MRDYTDKHSDIWNDSDDDLREPVRLADLTEQQLADMAGITLLEYRERVQSLKPDPRDPDHTRDGMFVLHNCSYCRDGMVRCVKGNPRRCPYPHARND